MMSFQMLVCVAAAIASTWAAIPYADVKINIFDIRPRDFENNILNLKKNTHQFYKEHNVTSQADELIGTLAEHTPYVKEMIKTVTDFHKTMAEESEWRVLFTKAMTDESLIEIAKKDERRMESTMETIESKIKVLGDGNPDKANRKTIASILHMEIDKMINFFDLKSALARKFPLLGTPPLIQLASLVAIFAPYAKALNPTEAMNSKISCKMRDVLIDYRPRAVNARLHQVYANTSIFQTKVKVMQMPFNAKGYSRTNPGSIDCALKPDETQTDAFWLKDEFGSDQYWVNNKDSTCVEDYVALVRHRVEEIFPVDILSKVCVDPKPNIPTGFGALTINIQTIFAYGEADGTACKIAGFHCNSYFKLFIGGKEVFRSQTRKDQFVYDAEYTHVTGKIPKDTKIKIEVYDESSAFFEKTHLILSTEGNVESFLKEPLRKGALVQGERNAVETVSFWQDDYKDQ